MAKKIDLAEGLTHFKAKENASIAITEATSTASAPHKAGEYFYYKGDLVIATADIAQGGTITLNTNCKKQPLADSVCELKAAVTPINDAIVKRSVFNGTDSVCEVSAITLSQNGDSLEIEVFPEVSTDAYGYSFASNGNKANISIGATTKGVAFRAADGTWLYLGNAAFSSDKTHYVIKVLYEEGNIKFYVDDELYSTYEGQKTLTITGFGKNNYWSYWKGQVGYIKVNGTSYNTLSDLGGYSATSVSIVIPYGFLTEQQYKTLAKCSSKITIDPTATAVNVYVPIASGIYGKIVIGYESSHTDANYVDYWRINDSGMYASEDGLNFVSISGSLLVGAENEMTIAFQGMGDYTGGYHGDERIDLGNDCYVKFIVDDAEYSISDLVNLGKTVCDSFAYREVSELFASYSYNTGHLKIADHTKITEFTNSGFKTTNFVKVDLTDFGADTLKIITAFTGLFCISSTFASDVVSDVGAEYQASHPVSTTTLVEDMNEYCRKAKMLNNNCSCEMDSALISTNLEGYKEPPIKVDIADRQFDLKYYSYLPLNVDAQTGDYLATEGYVKWTIK